MFVDRVQIQAVAGDGGNGCCSFRREKFVPRGGPDGGDGGKGGDVILEVNPHLNNLVEFKFQPILRAKRGEHGQGKQCFGRNAPDAVGKVPVGTVVYRLPDEGPPPDPLDVDDLDEAAPARRRLPDPVAGHLPLVADLVEPGQRFVLCAGGRGGRGNAKFKSSINRAPRQHEKGFPGGQGRFLLELRSIADIGLVGYPNAGKSTLLSRLSAATPKVAPYPFTTLTPHLGMVELPDYRRFFVADIPGLIEGAHAGAGLGHDFLKHVERCKALLFVVDIAGSEGRDPVEDYNRLRTELKLFREDLAGRPFLIAANKMDLPGAAENLARFRAAVRGPLLPISAETRAGIAELVRALAQLAFPP